MHARRSHAKVNFFTPLGIKEERDNGGSQSFTIMTSYQVRDESRNHW